MGETKDKKKQKILEEPDAVGKPWSQSKEEKKESMVGIVCRKKQVLRWE